jgi:hypothetical protein
LPVKFVHPGGLQGDSGVSQLGELVHQNGPLGSCLGYCPYLGGVSSFGLGLAGFGCFGGVVGGLLGVRRGGGKRLRRSGGSFRGFEGPATAGRNGLQRCGLLEPFAVAADECRERRVQAPVAVEVASQLAHLFAGFVLCLHGHLGPCGGDFRRASPRLQLHQRLAVGVICLQRQCEGDVLGAGGLRQKPFDRGDLVRRRAFIGLRRRDVLGRGHLR